MASILHPSLCPHTLQCHFTVLPIKGWSLCPHLFPLDQPCDLPWPIEYDKNDSVLVLSLDLRGLGQVYSLFLGNLPRSHVNKLGLAYGKVRHHIEQRQVISLAGLTESCLKPSLQPRFLYLWTLTRMVVLNCLCCPNWEASTLTSNISLSFLGCCFSHHWVNGKPKQKFL